MNGERQMPPQDDELESRYGDWEPVIGLGSTLALRLASFASLNYVFDLERDPDLSTRSQIEHSLLLRFAYKVF